jgi:DNA gyrase subunit A
MVTKLGVIKRTALPEFEYQRKGGKIAISLDEGDELLFVVHTKGGEGVMIATANGAATRFDEETVRVMGRTARGVRGMRLSDDDFVVGAVLVDEQKMLMTVTERGYGKRTEFNEFRQMKNRGGSGVICHNISDKTGKLAGICAVEEQDDLMLITDQGTIIRTPVAGINTYSRSASGVIVMRLDDDQKIVNFTKVSPDEKKDEENEAEVTETPATEATEIVVPVLEENKE